MVVGQGFEVLQHFKFLTDNGRWRWFDIGRVGVRKSYLEVEILEHVGAIIGEYWTYFCITSGMCKLILEFWSDVRRTVQRSRVDVLLGQKLLEVSSGSLA